MNFQEIKQDRVLPEIQLFEQGGITLAACQKANTVIAEKYGVFSYDIDRNYGQGFDGV